MLPLSQSELRKIVRHLYLDESGIDKKPFTVVAGFMLHVDDQYEDFVHILGLIARDRFNNELPKGFVFHAKDLWHGSGFFPREEWCLQERMEILRELTDLLVQFKASVVYASVSREEVSGGHYAILARHQLAFLGALADAEKVLAQRYPHERAFLIAEDHTTHRRGLQQAFDLLYDKDLQFELKQNGLEQPFQRMVETPLFQPKNGTSPTQVADMCAFLIRRRLEGCEYAREITEKLTPLLPSGWRTQFIRS